MIKTFGKHRVRVGDVHNTKGMDALLNGVITPIFYVDPPWGTGTIKMFDTINKKMTGSESTGNLNEAGFLTAILQLAVKHTKGWVVVEYSLKGTDAVIQEAERLGLHHCVTIETIYSGKNRPMNVIIFRTDAPWTFTSQWVEPIYHTKDNNTVKAVFDVLVGGQNVRGHIAVDVCCGFGNTAKAALKHGMTFYGNELNIARATKCFDYLQKQTK